MTSQCSRPWCKLGESQLQKAGAGKHPGADGPTSAVVPNPLNLAKRARKLGGVIVVARYELHGKWRIPLWLGVEKKGAAVTADVAQEGQILK